MSASGFLDELLGFKARLDEEDALPSELLKVLDELSKLEIDREALQKTKIGVSVAKLKKSENHELSSKSTKLVEHWRQSVSSKKPSTATGGGTSPQATSSSATSKKEGTTSGPGTSGPGTSGTETIIGGGDDGGGDNIPDYPGPNTNEDKRDKVRQILFRALYEGVEKDQRTFFDTPTAARLVAQVETELHKQYIQESNSPKEYNSQLRTIKSNLGDSRNPEFNAKLYLGGITPEQLAKMTSAEMASDAKKRERQKAKKDLLEACQSDWSLRNIARAAGQFPCGRCKSDNTTYFQMQTRSSDEPMTTYVNCLNCGNRWKF